MKLIKFENCDINETKIDHDSFIVFGFRFDNKKLDSFYVTLNSIFNVEKEFVDPKYFETKTGFGFNRYGFRLRKFKINKAKAFYPIFEQISSFPHKM